MDGKELLEYFETPDRIEVRRLALAELMGQPDPPDIQGKRKRYYKFGGDKLKQPMLKVELEQAYLRHRMLLIGREESHIISFRRG